MVTPLGESVDANFNALVEGRTGVRSVEGVLPNTTFFASAFDRDFSEPFFLENITIKCVNQSLRKLNDSQIGGRWLLVFCTTKGDVDAGLDGDLSRSNPIRIQQKLQSVFPFEIKGKTISLACVSGVAGVVYAADKIRLNEFDHVMVVGGDLVSSFTAAGFQSFQALSNEVCLPYDDRRTGLNLGEGAASVVLSKNQGIFQDQIVEYLGGATSNDANHISGPSRTGEGLFIAVDKALEESGVSPHEINLISAHGTATRYNDDMESIAFNRHGMGDIPLHSLKGNFGHSLGASSLIELVMGMECMNRSILLPTRGCEQPGTTETLHVIQRVESANVDVLLKTASGFGGVNASAIFKRVQ